MHYLRTKNIDFSDQFCENNDDSNVLMTYGILVTRSKKINNSLKSDSLPALRVFGGFTGGVPGKIVWGTPRIITHWIPNQSIATSDQVTKEWFATSPENSWRNNWTKWLPIHPAQSNRSTYPPRSTGIVFLLWIFLWNSLPVDHCPDDFYFIFSTKLHQGTLYCCCFLHLQLQT